MRLVLDAFASYYGIGAYYIITLCIVMFALATVVCWGYYGKEMLSYLSRSRTLSVIYVVLFCAVAAAGAVMQENTVWQISDITVALMTALNLSAVWMLRREVREETEIAGLYRPKRH
jgi:AGCS family alanine or glycine:cation symporter